MFPILPSVARRTEKYQDALAHLVSDQYGRTLVPRATLCVFCYAQSQGLLLSRGSAL